MRPNSKTKTTHYSCSLCGQKTHHASTYSIESDYFCPECVTQRSCKSCGCDIIVPKDMINEGQVCQECYEKQNGVGYSFLFILVGIAISGLSLYYGIVTGFNRGGGILFLFGVYLLSKGL